MWEFLNASFTRLPVYLYHLLWIENEIKCVFNERRTHHPVKHT